MFYGQQGERRPGHKDSSKAHHEDIDSMDSRGDFEGGSDLMRFDD